MILFVTSYCRFPGYASDKLDFPTPCPNKLNKNVSLLELSGFSNLHSQLTPLQFSFHKANVWAFFFFCLYFFHLLCLSSHTAMNFWMFHLTHARVPIPLHNYQMLINNLTAR